MIFARGLLGVFVGLCGRIVIFLGRRDFICRIKGLFLRSVLSVL